MEAATTTTVLPASWSHEYDLIASYLKEEPMILPELMEYTVPIVWKTTLFITLLSVLLYSLLKNLMPKTDSTTVSFKTTVFQLTNLVVNLVFGGLGVYYFTQFPSPQEEDFRALATGYNDMALFPAAQVGYQIWGVVYALRCIKESPLMLLHHFSAVLAAAPAVLTVAFRYYSPFFGGVVEVSSVPLAMMNLFKNNKSLVGDYPRAYSTIRLVFASTFLYTRCYLWISYVSYYGRLVLFSAMAAPHLGLQVYLFTSVVGIVALSLMQVYWGLLILRGFFKTYFRATFITRPQMGKP